MARVPTLDLNLLRVVVALFDAGSVTRAAERLQVGQPAVSGSLARLRRHFHDPLFVRSAHGMAPTPRGAEVADAAREILRQADEKLRPDVVFEPGLRHRAFTFALSDVGEVVFLPRLVEALGAASPDTPVRSVTLRPAALAAALEAGEVDLAIGYFPDLKARAFYQQQLFTHRFVCLLRAGHPLAQAPLTLGDFLAARHVVVQSEGRSQEIFEAHLEAQGLTRRVAVYTPHFLGVRRLVASSDLIATVPHALGAEYGKPGLGLVALPPPFDPPRIELRQHWHRKAHRDARNAWLRARVAELFNAATDEW